MLPQKLQHKLNKRASENSVRRLGLLANGSDFSSNDYLGFSKNKTIYLAASEMLKQQNLEVNGATGSRLLSGNHQIYTDTEAIIASFHNCENALIFNSGYDANIGFFSSVPQRGDIILYDELCHASIRDGIKMSNAKAYKFSHNNLEDLLKRLQGILPENKDHLQLAEGQLKQEIYIITESIFSMDGDQPDLKEIIAICKKYNAHLIIDEAHAIGVFGAHGKGLVQELDIENEVFARIITFGKALGCHGAAILGSENLKNYLLNFARSFIYTTGLPPHSIATIQAGYQELMSTDSSLVNLKSNIVILNNEIIANHLEGQFISSSSAIHCCLIAGNDAVKKVSKHLIHNGFDVKPILSPTVPKGEERLRICVHSYNTVEEIEQLIKQLSSFIKSNKQNER
jgi:8-amino-7-oxononanoate synthase